MEIHYWRSEEYQTDNYMLSITDNDLRNVPLDPLDHALIKQCQNGSVADILLVLHTIAFRLQQSHEQARRKDAEAAVVDKTPLLSDGS